MVNSEEFSKRLQYIIDFYDLSASSFADKVGVQRSSISHILSGRNKPSLDFILKTIDAFPEVSLYWLLLNKGSFPPSETITIDKKEENEPGDLFSETETTDLIKETEESNDSKSEDSGSIRNRSNRIDAIDRVIIFFKDGSFKEYHN